MVPVLKPHARPRTQRGHLRVPVTQVGGAERLRGSTFLDWPHEQRPRENPQRERASMRIVLALTEVPKSSLRQIKSVLTPNNAWTIPRDSFGG